MKKLIILFFGMNIVLSLLIYSLGLQRDIYPGKTYTVWEETELYELDGTYPVWEQKQLQQILEQKF